MKLEMHRHQDENIRNSVDRKKRWKTPSFDEIVSHIQKYTKMKFVVVEKDDERILRVMPIDHTHTGEVFHFSGEKPIGGGFYKQGELFWESSSFIDRFGFDRPEDKETADQIISQVSELLRQRIEEICRE